MLMVKKQSIASFIEKLPMDGSVGDCESTLLMTNMNYTGIGSNGDGYTNADRDTCTFSVNEKKMHKRRKSLPICKQCHRMHECWESRPACKYR